MSSADTIAIVCTFQSCLTEPGTSTSTSPEISEITQNSPNDGTAMRGPKISVVQLFLDASSEDEEAVPPRTTTCINFANLEDTLDDFIEDPIEELINSIYEGEPDI